MKVFENISLKPYNTFGIDVKARRVVVLEPGDEVPPLEGEVLVIGAGSNMVFTKDYEGTVITLSKTFHLSPFTSHLVTAWGGMVMDDLIQYTIDQGLYGLENLSAIPGTVGASAVQNVGAYGAEAKDFIERVEAYDLQERRHCTFSNADCHFAYRDSFFKHHPGRYLILRVTYRLSNTFTPNLSYKALENLPHYTAQQLREAIIEVRWNKLPRPEEHGSAGSFFKNPVVDEDTYLRLKDEYPDMPDAHMTPASGGYKLSAGWLIDMAGWKGRTLGRAGVWPKNALVLYNADGCSGDEVRALAAAIQQDVKQKFGVALDPEAIII
ncbi:MAG: UDP-N-acetylmuramate dehydrogenase [Bacteroidales bacterium]|nr:UDP-N-acetylmuramate dehydrogenase [Bacteroidales bacterium]